MIFPELCRRAARNLLEFFDKVTDIFKSGLQCCLCHGNIAGGKQCACFFNAVVNQKISKCFLEIPAEPGAEIVW